MCLFLVLSLFYPSLSQYDFHSFPKEVFYSQWISDNVHFTPQNKVTHQNHHKPTNPCRMFSCLPITLA